MKATHATRTDGYTLIEVLIVLGIIGVVSAVALPMVGNSLRDYRLSGDARTISNTLALAKMRAAATFTQTRLYTNLTSRNYKVQRLVAGEWIDDGGSITLSNGVALGFNGLATAPPNTQATIAQAPLCQNDAGTNVANTACVLFNSRGVPVDNTGAPSGVDALYVTDGTAVSGITVAATGLVRSWRSPANTVRWSRQ